MARETKVGLMMVAVVVGVFGFLVYKRVHRPLEGLAEQTPREERVLDEERRDEFGEQPSAARQLQQQFKKRERQVVNGIEKVADKVTNKVEKVANKVETFAEEFIEEVAPPKPDKRRKPPMPTEVASDDDFDQFTAPRKPREEQTIPIPGPAEFVFEAPPQPKMQPPKTQIVQKDSIDSNPFDEEIPTQKIKPVQFDAPARNERVAEADDFGDRAFPAESRPNQVASEFDTRRDEPRPIDDGFDNVPRGRHRPAPSTMIEDRIAARDPEIQAAVSNDRQSYVIQPNDNFWSISRKVYGAGRYYKALATHNQKTIPDPQMMKPGMVIATPDAGLLEQRYAELIPRAAASDPVTSVSTMQSRKPVDNEPSGYFMTPEGVPMYRVGENDTLTGIAKSHLGRTSRWVQILEMNRNVVRDGNELKIGMVLRLPADASRVQVVGTAREYR